MGAQSVRRAGAPRVKMPTSLPRLVSLEEGHRCVSAGRRHRRQPGDISGHEIEDAFSFQVLRDTDMEIQEDEAPDLLETIKQGLRERQFGPVVRLAVDEAMPDEMVHLLMENLDVALGDVYPLQPPLAMGDLWGLHGLNRPELKDAPFVPARARRRNSATSRPPTTSSRPSGSGDILLHHPYDSFKPVLDFINVAAVDPDVLAIKQTLYRVGRNAPVVRSLLEAQRNGKHVAVLVELKARFDEESNMAGPAHWKAQGYMWSTAWWG